VQVAVVGSAVTGRCKQENLKKGIFMKRILSAHYRTAACVAAVLLGGLAAPAGAIELKNADGTWTFSANGNVNVHYILSNCESTSTPAVAGGLACLATASSSSVSNIGNGLLPAAISFGIATTQDNYDLSAHFGFYPGVATNDGGSPNLQASSPITNTALGSTGLDIRQIYMTFGNKEMGTFTLGRNIGLFGADVILNDMTLPGVGGAGSAATHAPANTTLGSIGLGYIYTDWLAQIDYTTPTYSGFNATFGIFDPLDSLTPGAHDPDPDHPGKFLSDTPSGKKEPGLHGKLTESYSFSDTTKLYLSVAFLTQKQNYSSATTGPYEYTGTGYDLFARIDVSDFEAFAYYYNGSGLGTTGLFVLADDGNGNKRDSDGYMGQVTYKVGKAKFGVNYGVSNLDLASGEINAGLVKSNTKVTGGLYYSLTKNLTLLGEYTDVEAKAQNGNKNKGNNFNIGAFLSF
jgi:predicted porin